MEEFKVLISQEEIQKRLYELAAQLDKDYEGKEIVVLYGGSVNPDNFKSILNTKGVDGALIGGACLDANKFSSMIKSL